MTGTRRGFRPDGTCGRGLHDITKAKNVHVYPSGVRVCVPCRAEKRLEDREHALAVERKRHARLGEARLQQMRDYRAANPEVVAAWGRRRRALLAGVPSEPYRLRQVVAKSKGACALCLEPVDLSLRYPDPRSRSVDHIVPLILGGPDTLANVQLAHLRCNLQKWARLEGETEPLTWANEKLRGKGCVLLQQGV